MLHWSSNVQLHIRPVIFLSNVPVVDFFRELPFWLCAQKQRTATTALRTNAFVSSCDLAPQFFLVYGKMSYLYLSACYRITRRRFIPGHHMLSWKPSSCCCIRSENDQTTIVSIAWYSMFQLYCTMDVSLDRDPKVTPGSFLSFLSLHNQTNSFKGNCRFIRYERRQQIDRWGVLSSLSLQGEVWITV